MSIHEKSKWTFCKAKEFLQEDKKWSDAVFKFCWILGLLNTDSFINFCDKLNSETNTQANKSKRAHFWTDQCINFNEGPICSVQWVVCLRSSKREAFVKLTKIVETDLVEHLSITNNWATEYLLSKHKLLGYCTLCFKFCLFVAFIEFIVLSLSPWWLHSPTR